MRLPSKPFFPVLTAGVLAAFFSGCLEVVPKPQPPPTNRPPEIAATLRDLINQEEKQTVNSAALPNGSLNQLLEVATPAGYLINLRYNYLGIPLVEALRLTKDDELMRRLLELAKWSDSTQARAEALVTLANFADDRFAGLYQTALQDKDVGLNWAAVEGLEIWGSPTAVSMLQSVQHASWSPLLTVYTAKALLTLGDASGLPALYRALEDRSWIVRAMAARYLGEYAPPADYPKLLTALNQENRNNYVAAELAVATLKLLAKAEVTARAAAARKGWSEGKTPGYAVTKDNVVEMEPLLIVPPRLYLPENVQVAQAINNRLIDLIENQLDTPLNTTDQNDPNLQDLYALLTPAGNALKVRYSNLGIVVAEGLAGTNDAFLRTELRRLADSNPNTKVRAAALLALGYSRTPEDYPLIQRSLRDPDPVVRFGALEAAQAGHIKEAVPDLLNIAYQDAVPAFRIFAMQVLVTFNDPVGHSLLITNVTNSDWPARALTAWYLGRYGNDSDREQLLGQLSQETNPFVLAELCIAIQRLAPL